MAEVKRVIWIVLDSVGIGELPDADKFGDVGSNTLCNTAKAVGGLKIPNMVQLGIGNIAGITGIEKCEQPKGCYGRLAEISNGKDTTIGHWEMTGIYSPDPFPVYPDGFPQEVIEPFIKETGVSGILGNIPASGTEIIKQLGEEHIRTGKPIIYTSGDSVFQIAAHEDVKQLVKGVMIESYIEPGNQKVGEGVYGKSITDACLGWEESERLLYDIADLI
jgi:phosphopentomutase